MFYMVQCQKNNQWQALYQRDNFLRQYQMHHSSPRGKQEVFLNLENEFAL